MMVSWTIVSGSKIIVVTRKERLGECDKKREYPGRDWGVQAICFPYYSKFSTKKRIWITISKTSSDQQRFIEPGKLCIKLNCI